MERLPTHLSHANPNKLAAAVAEIPAYDISDVVDPVLLQVCAFDDILEMS